MGSNMSDLRAADRGAEPVAHQDLTSCLAVEATSGSATPVGQGRLRRSRGATMVEYAILVSLIALVAILAVRALGQRVSASYSRDASMF